MATIANGESCNTVHFMGESEIYQGQQLKTPDNAPDPWNWEIGEMLESEGRNGCEESRH